MPHKELVVGRQAIFGRDRLVYGYELLYRSVRNATDASSTVDGDLMTTSVLFSSMNIGIERLVGNKVIFCNADRGLITGRVPIMLPPEQTVVEVLETVAPDPEIVRGCQRLVAQGYRLALDDFTWFDGAEALLRLASIVKLDLRRQDREELQLLIKRCREFDVELLAEKIETAEEIEDCLDLEFDYLQGYALSRPRTVPGRKLSTSNVARLQIATRLIGRDFDPAELESILRTEPGMTYQLLQMASVGARSGLRREIRSVREALVLVGSRRVQSWVALLMLRPANTATDDDLSVVLSRARMCELLAGRHHPAIASDAFTAGILSAFDLLLGVPAEEIAQTLPISPELREAAFGTEGPIAAIVRDVIDFQAGITSAQWRSGLVDCDFDAVSIPALTWAVDMTTGVAPS